MLGCLCRCPSVSCSCSVSGSRGRCSRSRTPSTRWHRRRVRGQRSQPRPQSLTVTTRHRYASPVSHAVQWLVVILELDSYLKKEGFPSIINNVVTVRLISGLKLLITDSFAVQINSLINITDCVSGNGVWIVQSISQQDSSASCPALSGRRGRLDGRPQEEVKRTTESWTVELLPTSDLQVAPMSEPRADSLFFF